MRPAEPDAIGKSGTMRPSKRLVFHDPWFITEERGEEERKAGRRGGEKKRERRGGRGVDGGMRGGEEKGRVISWAGR